MRRNDQRLLETAKAALAYARANLPTDPAHRSLVYQLAAMIDHMLALAIEQDAGQRANIAIRAHRQLLRKKLAAGLLRHVLTVTRLAAIEHPDGFGVTRLPRANAGYDAFETTLQRVLEQTRQHADLLHRHGLGAGAIAELEAGKARLDELSAEIVASHLQHMAATKQIMFGVANTARLLSLLDGVYRYLLVDDPSNTATWANIRRLSSRNHPAPPNDERSA